MTTRILAALGLAALLLLGAVAGLDYAGGLMIELGNQEAAR